MTIFSRIPSKTALLSLLLIASLILSGWLARNLLISSNNVKSNQANTPDAFMTGMHYTQYDPQGKWKSSLDAERMVHYSAQDTAVFDKPVMVSRDENQLTWIISANHSTTKHGSNIVYLKDNVQIQRFDATNQKNLDLITSTLTAYPKQHTMETNQPVTIVQPGSVVNAVGLTGNMQTGDINLLSNTHGVYQEVAKNVANDQQKSSVK